MKRILLLLCLALVSLNATARLGASPQVYATEKTRDIVGGRKVVERGEDFVLFSAPRDNSLNYLVTLKP